MTVPDSEQAPLETGFYATVDGSEVRALRAAKNAARTEWRMTHVQLDSAVRQAARRGDEAIAHEIHEEHLAARQEWISAEAQYIAARLGFRHEPLPPRDRRRPGGTPPGT